jgi:hypothetical protein
MGPRIFDEAGEGQPGLGPDDVTTCNALAFDDNFAGLFVVG